MMASNTKTLILLLDHLVLTVVSIPDSIAFYTQHMGMREEVFDGNEPGKKRHSLVYGEKGREMKINLHEKGKVKL